MQHVDIRVLAEDVGFSVMLEMPMIPPVGRGSLRKQRFNIRVKLSERNYRSRIQITFK